MADYYDIDAILERARKEREARDLAASQQTEGQAPSSQSAPSQAAQVQPPAGQPPAAPPNTGQAPVSQPQVPAYVPAIGAGVGAYSAHKGFGKGILKNLFSPDPSVYAPAPVSKVPLPSVGPSVTQRAEPFLFSGLPSTPQNVTSAFPETPQPPASEVETIMQSTRDSGPTGRQMESGHNWESNRMRLAQEAAMETNPTAVREIVSAGPMAPTRAGIAVRKALAIELEDERKMAEARQKIIEAQRKAAEETQRMARETEIQRLQREAEQAAARKGLIRGVTKVGLGGLGGGLAAKDLYAAVQDMRKQGLTDENIAEALGGVGGLMMMVPTLPTELLGGALQAGSIAYPYVKKAMH
jgi:hypothetical protein